MSKLNVSSAETVKAFLDEVKTQTDRGAAIIAASVLDELFKRVILERLIVIGGERSDALFNKIGAPLASFSAKIELAFALGIISNDARLAAHPVRDVRNKFAHRIEPLSFDHSEVSQIILTRASKNAKALAGSTRDKFLAIFHSLAMVLYGTLAADIRIKSLEATHAEHFVAMMKHILSVSAGQNSSKES